MFSCQETYLNLAAGPPVSQKLAEDIGSGDPPCQKHGIGYHQVAALVYDLGLVQNIVAWTLSSKQTLEMDGLWIGDVDPRAHDHVHGNSN